MTNTAPRRGRRPGKPDTRAQILEAARRRFLTQGYDEASMRDIAVDADVDLALISYYFGSKKGLFGAVLALPANPADLVNRLLEEGDPATFPERALRHMLHVWDDPVSGPILLATLKNAAADDTFADLLKEMLGREVIDRIAARLTGPNRLRRAGAFSTVMAGLITARYMLRLEPVASMNPDALVRVFGPQLRMALSAGSGHRGPARSRSASR
ncbi:TetR family transcriptional regulator [Streptomyces krungchingensis]|uniref:TetR/AcrR family transcriptional regulator n=1 Tax=Streptomyces krungchingensis TaxID=1565034 RepID=UPI003CF05185